MPLPPSYKCPVCQKERQRGLIGDHVVSHTFEELKSHIINSNEVRDNGAHPEVLCSGHVYVLCIKTKQGFEKGLPKHSRHICKNNYSSLIAKDKKLEIKQEKKPVDQDMYSMTMNQVLDICRKKNLRGYSHKKKEEIIEIILEHDKLQLNTNVVCNCHNEIIQLKEELRKKEEELDKFRIWQTLILNSAPSNILPQETTLLDIVYSEKEELEEQKPTNGFVPEDTPAPGPPPKLTVIKDTKPSATIKASKKEKEKGMYCTKCEVCDITARNDRELKPCGKCNKMCHFNSDFYSCYHWDCAYCGTQICMDCNKAAGGNKLFAFCSKDCSKKHNS